MTSLIRSFKIQLTGTVLKIGAAIVIGFVSASAHAQVTTLDFATLLAKSGISEEQNKNYPIAQEICNAAGISSLDCSSYTTVGQALCLSKGRSSLDCSTYTTIGQGICLAGKRSSLDCSTYTAISQGICLSTGRSTLDCSPYVSNQEALCLAKGQSSTRCSGITLADALRIEVEDIDWAWDKFYDAQYQIQWRCRGTNTGQFAEDYNCSGKMKDDNTWPGMRNGT
jgi:hypothetical protein